MSDEAMGREIAAALFGGTPVEPEQPSVDDELRRSIAEQHGLPAELADRLRGTTRAEIDADAEQLAALVKQEPPEPEHVKVARDAIEAAERMRSIGFGVNQAKAERDRALVELFHPAPSEGDEE